MDSDFIGRTSHGVDVCIKFVTERAQKVQSPVEYVEPSIQALY